MLIGYLNILICEGSEPFAHFSLRLFVFSLLIFRRFLFFCFLLLYIGYEAFVEKKSKSLHPLYGLLSHCVYFNTWWSWITKLISWPTNGSQTTVCKTLQCMSMQSSWDPDTPERGPSGQAALSSISLEQHPCMDVQSTTVWRTKATIVAIFNFQIKKKNPCSTL